MEGQHTPPWSFTQQLCASHSIGEMKEHERTWSILLCVKSSTQNQIHNKTKNIKKQPRQEMPKVSRLELPFGLTMTSGIKCLCRWSRFRRTPGGPKPSTPKKFQIRKGNSWIRFTNPHQYSKQKRLALAQRGGRWWGGVGVYHRSNRTRLQLSNGSKVPISYLSK